MSLQRHEIVSVNEAGFDSKPRPVHGYAQKGRRATAQFRQSSDRTRHTLLMAVSSHASSHHVFHSGRVNGKAFAEFVASMPFPSGAVLVLDNASIPKTREVQQVMARKGYTPMYTPPYSPEFNPLEHCFGAIKTRCYRQQPRAMQAAHPQSTLELAQGCVQQYLAVMSACGLPAALPAAGQGRVGQRSC